MFHIIVSFEKLIILKMLKLNILKQEVINNLNQRHTFRSAEYQWQAFFRTEESPSIVRI